MGRSAWGCLLVPLTIAYRLCRAALRVFGISLDDLADRWIDWSFDVERAFLEEESARLKEQLRLMNENVREREGIRTNDDLPDDP